MNVAEVVDVLRREKHGFNSFLFEKKVHVFGMLIPCFNIDLQGSIDTAGEGDMLMWKCHREKKK